MNTKNTKPETKPEQIERMEKENLEIGFIVKTLEDIQAKCNFENHDYHLIVSVKSITNAVFHFESAFNNNKSLITKLKKG